MKAADSIQGSQFTGYEWQEFLEQHDLVTDRLRTAAETETARRLGN